jgi:hypothetical protein
MANRKISGTRTAFLNMPGAQKFLENSLDDKMIMIYEYSRIFKGVEVVSLRLV